MKYWQENVDKIIEFNEKSLLKGAGSISKLQMENKVDAIYKEFNARRKKEDAKQADRDDLNELKRLSNELMDR